MKKLNKTTFIEKAKDNPKDRINVVIGDDKQPDFKPQIKIERWDNESNVSIRLKDNEFNGLIPTNREGKLKLEGVTREAHFYPLENGYEFEVILKEKPKSNVIEFTLEDKDVEYFYQPELTQEEKDKGAKRPENVVGSYAVYAKSNKVNYVDGKEYKVGKIGHIYRPKIIDSVGKEVWGELKIENGTLSVTIPQEFLDKAVYPVRHAAGLTFGYTSAGESDEALFNPDQGWGIDAAPASSGTATSITAWCKEGTESTNDGVFKGVLWGTNLNIITNGVGGASGIISGFSATEYTSTFGTSPSVVGSTHYWVGLVDNVGGGGDSDSICYDNGDAGDGIRNYANQSYATPVAISDPYAEVVTRYSIYCTYTAEGGSSASVSPSTSPSASASVSPSASASISPSVSASASASVSPSASASISPSLSPSVSASVSPSLSPSVSPSVSPSPSESPRTKIQDYVPHTSLKQDIPSFRKNEEAVPCFGASSDTPSTKVKENKPNLR